MKKDIAEYVAKFANCQQVKAKHLTPSGVTYMIEVTTWKWESIDMDFVVGIPNTMRQHDSTCVIVDRITMSAHFKWRIMRDCTLMIL